VSVVHERSRYRAGPLRAYAESALK
jgi:hypothetical protein